MNSSGEYQLIDFSSIQGVPCPCGTARRSLMDEPRVPYSLHVTEISTNATVHYHRQITETYFILDCQPDACLELDGQAVAIKPGQAVVIHPGTRHRAVGKMKVIIIASPKFDPNDEWFDAI
jgi:mannose-6-phosphate isomerase-like protein (cupin superfamily)